MKKHLIFLLILFFALSVTYAETFYYEIKQEYSVSQIETNLQAVIDNAASNDMIVVTGSKTNANVSLILNIATGKTVVWQATYQSNSAFVATNLISFSGNGMFEVANGTLITENATALNATGTSSTVIVSGNGKVQTSGNGVHAINTNGNVEIKDNAQVSGTTGEVIMSQGNNAIIKVSGGSVTATSENAICALGSTVQILVSGGYVSNDATAPQPPTIVAYSPSSVNSLVHISGTGKVEAKGDGNAIIATGGSVRVSGNAQVVSNLTGGNWLPSAIRASHGVEVSDNAKVSASNNYAIVCFNNVIVRDNSIIEAKENAIAIYIYGSGGLSNGSVTVSDKAQVIAANNYAISNNVTYFTLNVNGGVVFAYGNKISDVINNSDFTLPANYGVVLAWDKEADNTNYEVYNTDDIFKLPETTTAYWDKKEAKSGISYANGENTGFIPIVEVTVNTHTPTYHVTVINGSGAGDYQEGDLVTITADPAPAGQQFKEWTITPPVIFVDETNVTTPTAKFNMPTTDVTATATYEPETGIEELRMANGEWRIYPNPTTGILTIQISDYQISDYPISDYPISDYPIFDIVIYDRLCRIQQIEKSKNRKSEINISHLPAGVYFVKIRTEADEVVKKVVKE